MRGALDCCLSISNELLAEKSEAALISTVSCGSSSSMLAPPPIPPVPSDLLELPWRQAMAWVVSAVPGSAANWSNWERTGATRRRADVLGGPGLRGLGLDLGFCAWLRIGRASAEIDAVGAGGEADAAGFASTVPWTLVVAAAGHFVIRVRDSAAKGGLLKLLRLPALWSSSFDVQAIGLHTQKGILGPDLRFFARLHAPSWCGRALGIHGRKELLDPNMLCHLQHLHHHFQPDPFMISNSRYANFVFFHLEIIYSVYWSIEHDAQSLECLSWNLFITVNRGSQVSIIVKTLHYDYVHTQKTTIKGKPIDPLVASEVRIADQESNELTYQMTSMHIAGNAILLVEQDILSMFSSTRLCLFDDMHGEDAVLVVRVDPPAVDYNTSVVVSQIQRRGLLRLSSVRDIQYLQLFTPLSQVHTPDKPSGEPLAGHQLVWSTEALEDCNCGTFGSELSADG